MNSCRTQLLQKFLFFLFWEKVSREVRVRGMQKRLRKHYICDEAAVTVNELPKIFHP